VYPDAQIWCFWHATDGVFRGRLVHHEGGAGQQALAMCEQNAVSNAVAKAKVVSVDDESLFHV
jgi:hypothetical protein